MATDEYTLHSILKDDNDKEIGDIYAHIDGSNEMPLITTLYRVDSTPEDLDATSIDKISKEGLDDKKINSLLRLAVDNEEPDTSEQEQNFADLVIKKQKEMATELGNDTCNIIEPEKTSPMSSDNPTIVDV